jgi:uncharacterized repeat protein (TIGR01451 family)
MSPFPVSVWIPDRTKKEQKMKHLSRTLLAGLAVLFFLSASLVQANPPGQDIVLINGPARRAIPPVGPDFRPAGLALVPAHNPTRAVLEATLAQNESYLDPEALPLNVQVSHSGIITGASHFVNDFSECMVYLDLTDPNHLLGSSKFFYDPAQYDFYTGVFESYDGGHAWTELQPPGVEDYSLTSDPVTTFDHLGNGYFTLLTRGPTGVDMLKKPAGGDWLPKVIVDRTTSTDKQWIMGDQDPQGISPYAGYLYMSWTSFGGPVTGIVLSRSTDGNTTWSAPIALAGGDVQGSVPGVAPDGTVYVVFGRGIFFGPTPATLEFVKSTNGGASFSAPAVAANITAIPYTLPNSWFRTPASLPAFAVSPTNGNLYLAWADSRNGDADIYFARSTDGGASWGPQVRLNDDPIGNGMDQFQPQLSVAPDGRVAAMWFDRRLACPSDLPWIPPDHRGDLNFCIDTFMTRSFDDGQTWAPNIRASAQTWDWTLNLPYDTGGNGFIGDYQGIASNDDYDFPFWNATANLGENAENYQEIFVAHVPVAERPDLSPSTKEVTPTLALPGDVLSYTVTLRNEGLADAPGARLSDTLPVSTTFISGSLQASSGQAGYDPAARTITWTGAVSLSAPVTVSFAAAMAPSVPDGAWIVNRAWITDGAGVGLWRAATTTVSLPPYILATRPADAAADVPVTASVVVTFSEQMAPASLGLTAVPDPGGWSAAWSAGDTVVTLAHAPFAYSTVYSLTVAAQDTEGDSLVAGPVPNPWTFTTEPAPPSPPFVVATGPADGALGVPITASVVVTFSEAMSTTSLSLTAVPNPGGWDATWSAGDTVVTLAHVPFAYSTTYSLAVWAEDAQGEGLVAGPVPNPWSFTTAPILPSPPFVVATGPADGAVDVPITASVVVTFSEAMSTTSLSLTAVPDPGGWDATWSAGDTVVILAHAPFTYGTAYTVTVWAEDVQGEGLVPGPVPNPWAFATAGRPRYSIYLPLVMRGGGR